MKIPVLLVNDSGDDQALMLRAIERAAMNIDAIVHPSCADALNWLLGDAQEVRTSPALILLDLATPHIDGVSFMQRIRADSQTRNIPVVVYSGDQNPQTIEACFAYGCNSYVHKPIRYAELTETVQLTIRYWLTVNCLAFNHIHIQPKRKNRL